MDAKEILREQFNTIIELSDEQFEYVFAHFRRISVKRGEKLIVPGNIVKSEYFVLDGCLKSYHTNDDLKIFILQFATSARWISDYDALYYKTKSTNTVDCVVDAEVLCLSCEDREKLCREMHEIEYFFRWRTNKGFVSVFKRLLSFVNNDARGRFNDLMETNPELYDIVNKGLIAAYLGVSRETLSRMNSKKSNQS